MDDKECMQENLKKKRQHCVDLGMDGRIILKLILEK
jgi:hypothetical protein